MPYWNKIFESHRIVLLCLFYVLCLSSCVFMLYTINIEKLLMIKIYCKVPLNDCSDNMITYYDPFFKEPNISLYISIKSWSELLKCANKFSKCNKRKHFFKFFI